MFDRNRGAASEPRQVHKSREIPGQLDLFGEPEAVAPLEEVPWKPAEFDEQTLELGLNLPEGLYLGTSSWSFPGWKGLVYKGEASGKELANHGLESYAKHPLFRSVSLDRTYYAPLQESEYRSYRKQLPEHFRMLVKAPELLTMARFPQHKRYGGQQGKANPGFLSVEYAEQFLAPALTGLGSNLGPVLFQFPPQNPAELGGPAGFAQRLHLFFEALPQGVHYAVELRDPRLFSGLYLAVLERLGVGHCVNVHPTMPDPMTQWRQLEQSGPLVVRWMLGRGRDYATAKKAYAPFDRVVEPQDAILEQLAEICQQTLSLNRKVYVLVNNKAEGCAPESVRRLARALGSKRVAV